MNFDPYESHWRDNVPPITPARDELADDGSKGPRADSWRLRNARVSTWPQRRALQPAPFGMQRLRTQMRTTYFFRRR